MAQNAERVFEHDNWGRALAWSVGFHVAVIALIVLLGVLHWCPRRRLGIRRRRFGDRRHVSQFRSLARRRTTRKENVLANESRGVTKSEPKVEEREKRT